MIFDDTLLFSNAQAITADASSTNIVDLLATGTVYGAAAALSKDVGKGNFIPLLIQVVEDFTLLTSLRVVVQCDTVENFASPKSIIETTIALADLKAGRTFPMTVVPPGTNERYLRVYYDITGTAPDAGKVTAGIVHGVQTNGVTF